MNENKFEKYYGLNHYTLKEEASLPKNIINTRISKVKIIDLCSNMRNLIDTIEIRAKNIPEYDDNEHSEIVCQFVSEVQKAYNAIRDAIVLPRKRG